MVLIGDNFKVSGLQELNIRNITNIIFLGVLLLVDYIIPYKLHA